MTTTRPRLGLLVGANTFRNPGLTAKLATTLDHVSDGRAILGIGGARVGRGRAPLRLPTRGSGLRGRAGPPPRRGAVAPRGAPPPGRAAHERRRRDGERIEHQGGRFSPFHDALCEPRPVQDHLPILIGGSGPKKTLRTTAKYADMWNASGATRDQVVASLDILRDHCADLGRD